MRKVLRLEIVSKTDIDVEFLISEQSHKREEFGDKGNSFSTSNGIIFVSSVYPNILLGAGYINTIYVRGSNTDLDKKLLCCRVALFEQIQEAVKEYNDYEFEETQTELTYNIDNKNEEGREMITIHAGINMVLPEEKQCFETGKHFSEYDKALVSLRGQTTDIYTQSYEVIDRASDILDDEVVLIRHDTVRDRYYDAQKLKEGLDNHFELR